VRLSLRPDRVFRDYSEVTPELLQKHGIRLLLCDLDYTLAPRSVAQPDRAVMNWVERMRASGIQVVILSNNRRALRVRTFCEGLRIRYVGRAQKPRKRGFHAAMREENASATETAVLGDKLLTDMLGANLCGIWALMVEPKGGPVGAWNHVLHLLQRPFKAWRRERHESF